jgi:hypothetical protein
METEEFVSVEMIYDRIVRRGSLTFFSYRRPFLAITRAMGALVKLGEASLLRNGRQRRWRRPTLIATPSGQENQMIGDAFARLHDAGSGCR